MTCLRLILPFLPVLTLVTTLPSAEEATRRAPRDALKPFQDLVGEWKGYGIPEGTRQQQEDGAWSETIRWEWHLKGEEVWLKAGFEKGKHFVDGKLLYLPDKDRYQLALQTVDKESVTFEGALKERKLTLERQDDKKNEAQRLTIDLLHSNRYLYNYEVKPQDKPVYRRIYQVGASKPGFVPKGSDGPECIVTGGHATIKVTYKGQTYMVCCTGCKWAFMEEPEKYIKEYNEKKAKEKEAKEKK